MKGFLDIHPIDSSGAKGTQVVDGDMSADIKSVGIDLQHFTTGSVHIKWSGTSLNGSVLVQGSNVDDDDWYVTLTGGTYTLTSSSSGNELCELGDLGFRFARVFWDRTSGDGAMDVYIQAKE